MATAEVANLKVGIEQLGCLQALLLFKSARMAYAA